LDDACAASDLDYNGETIPAETVHKVYMASLNEVFAKVIRVYPKVKSGVKQAKASN
jgi:hypothetical protein